MSAESLSRPSSRLGAESPGLLHEQRSLASRSFRPSRGPLSPPTPRSDSQPIEVPMPYKSQLNHFPPPQTHAPYVHHSAAVPIRAPPGAPWGPVSAPVKVLPCRDTASEVAEIQKILRGVPAESPRTTFFGVSPPTRSTGVQNPLVQDAQWKRDPYHATHCNLQALREIDSKGASFLRSAESRGDWRLLLGSPDYTGALEDVIDSEDPIERPSTDLSERTTPHAGVFF